MSTKDLFSGHSQLYAAFRPTYPEELYDFLLPLIPEHNVAWDCATGNGQIARRLAQNFTTVCATDISSQQLREAPNEKNVYYSVQPAERTNFKDGTFDLVTVGQALHWFNLDQFFRELERVMKPGGVFAAWGYSHLEINEEIDIHVRDFYVNVVGPYWDDARRMVENQYADVKFPFELIDVPSFRIHLRWTLDHIIGYLQSWSATQAYIRATNRDPLPDLKVTLSKYWANETMEVAFPLFVKVGRL